MIVDIEDLRGTNLKGALVKLLVISQLFDCLVEWTVRICGYRLRLLGLLTVYLVVVGFGLLAAVGEED